MKKIMITVLLGAIFLMLMPFAVVAACPDQAVCQRYWQGNTEYGDRVGIISTSTCWKVGHQCRPWNCSGDNTTSDYWINRCIQDFNVKHVAGRVDDKICVTFPTVKTSMDGRALMTKDWCRNLQ